MRDELLKMSIKFASEKMKSAADTANGNVDGSIQNEGLDEERFLEGIRCAFQAHKII